MNRKQRDKAQIVSEKIKRGLITGLLILDSDLKYAVIHWKANPNQDQFWRRTIIRCGCAFVEGTLSFMRQVTQPCAEVFNVTFTDAEIEIITETRKVKVSNGFEIRPKFLRFSDNVKETLRLFAKAHDTNLSIDYGQIGFTELCAAFEVRNRLMHPKTQQYLQVSDADRDIAERGFKWYDKVLGETLTKCDPHTVLKKS